MAFIIFVALLECNVDVGGKVRCSAESKGSCCFFLLVALRWGTGVNSRGMSSLKYSGSSFIQSKNATRWASNIVDINEIASRWEILQSRLRCRYDTPALSPSSHKIIYSFYFTLVPEKERRNDKENRKKKKREKSERVKTNKSLSYIGPSSKCSIK